MLQVNVTLTFHLLTQQSIGIICQPWLTNTPIYACSTNPGRAVESPHCPLRPCSPRHTGTGQHLTAGPSRCAADDPQTAAHNATGRGENIVQNTHVFEYVSVLNKLIPRLGEGRKYSRIVE